ncbi:anthranilate synthase [Paenibacillus shirakamiensis]|uniref:Anthranilate synthase n=1 Tax=Paenibacillus shirakamiensis TaxID=1265935 RepID=A0ABS4JJE7_9BACL|nr:anthranilate synthase component I [Paenibacillus shirakamiensis]MBP2001241.1 anthranilate synthase [Paenibacillus shirakamiensis]
MGILTDTLINNESYVTQQGIHVRRKYISNSIDVALDYVLKQLDTKKGALFSSTYEYPGRYTRWDIGFINPPLEIRTLANQFKINALNPKGIRLLEMIKVHLLEQKHIECIQNTDTRLEGAIKLSNEIFFEENRSQQSSIFTLIRNIRDIFYSTEDSFLGLYGAFGYDLIFQFERMELKHKREGKFSELVLYLPDEITIIDHQMESAYTLDYEFSYGALSTEGESREAFSVQVVDPPRGPEPAYCEGKYAGLVQEALKSFEVGDLFEVVPTHAFYEKCKDRPTDIYSRLKVINPSPYGFIVNLGEEEEFLIGSSPEMYVRVTGDRIETCPISGTIKRGKDAIEDAERIRELLNSAKDEAELTMCTDVDRNDKSRICIPGSVKVIGRRQPEMYSHLIHTVDHVEGILEPQFDSLDAFITHMWAVTITGAPKRAAVKWIEEHEEASREFYGGAVGYLSFNGSINTGLILRTIHVKKDVAKIQVGATLLCESVPEDEEAETLTKAAALIQAIRGERRASRFEEFSFQDVGRGKQILIVDHEDSFVHTLGNYFKQSGAKVVTLRTESAWTYLQDHSFDLVVLSPGPGRPHDFQLSRTIAICLDKKIPVFGVCLGLQGIVEYFGGELDVLGFPRHGKKMDIHFVQKDEQSSIIFKDIQHVKAGLYHSLYAKQVPEALKITATTEDGIVMGIEHNELPVWAVQFHPESIMSAHEFAGQRMIANVLHAVNKV